MTEPRYLWFAPHAGLWSSFRLEHRLADALARDGRAVTMVHCRGVLDSYCPVMAAEHLAVTDSGTLKRRACADCRHNVGLVDPSSAYRSVWLDDFIDEGIREHADAVVAAVGPDDWMNVVVEGVPVGRYSTYLSMLHHKLPDVSSSAEAWAEYRSDLRNSLLVLGAMPALLAAVDPTHAVVYNPLYPTTRIFAEMATRHGAQLVGIAAGSFIPGRYESAGVYQHIMASQTTTDSTEIARSLDTPSTPDEVRAVGAHLAELVGGNDPWVYSSAPTRMSPAMVRETLGVRATSPVVVVLVSSPDETRSSMLVDAEYFRSEDRDYSDIPEFIENAVEAARLVPEVDVVFRLHPRLMPNKREKVVSPDLERITRLLAQLPPNAVVNDTHDGLSLYDVMLVADAALNQSSSAGLEFLTLGLPVVQYDPPRLGAYPRDFALLVGRRDVAALADALRVAVAQGWSIDNSRRAFRWYTAVLLRALLHLADVETAYPAVSAGGDEPAPVPAWYLRAARRVIPDSVREPIARRMARAARQGTMEATNEDERWPREWLARVDATKGDAPIWEPLLVTRGVPAGVEGEMLAIRHELSALLSRLGVRDGPGLGALRGALAELGEQVV